MKFTLLACLFFSAISALGAPLPHAPTADLPSAGNDKPFTRIVTVTITPASPPSTFTTSADPTSTPVPQGTVPSQALLNAREAQKLNSSFRNISLDDPCTTGTSACVEGALTECTKGRWAGPPCPGSEQCFAVPVDSLTAGTKLACMAEQTAASLIANAGATGGVFGGQ